MNAWGIKAFKNYLICLTIAAMLMVSCKELCNNSLQDEKNSPDGKFTASFFERNCGATTPYVQVISLRLSNKKLDPDNFDDWVFTIHGRSKIKIDWKDIDELSISYSGTGDTPTMINKWGKIKIFYLKEY